MTTPSPLPTPASATILRVSGMTCGHCAKTIERAAGGVPGVEAARVDLPAGTLTVQGRLDRNALAEAVRATGYGVEEN